MSSASGGLHPHTPTGFVSTPSTGALPLDPTQTLSFVESKKILKLHYVVAVVMLAVPSIQHVDGRPVQGDTAGGDGESHQGLAAVGQRTDRRSAHG